MSPAIPKSWPSLYHRRRAAPSGDDGLSGGLSLVRAPVFALYAGIALFGAMALGLPGDLVL